MVRTGEKLYESPIWFFQPREYWRGDLSRRRGGGELSQRRGGGGGENAFDPKKFLDPNLIASCFSGIPFDRLKNSGPQFKHNIKILHTRHHNFLRN